jgi:hypothetical protein
VLCFLFALVPTPREGGVYSKTNAAILLAHEYVKHGSFNAAFHVLPVQRGDVYEDASDAQHALRDMLNKTDQDAGQYKRWKRYEKHGCTIHRLSEKDIDLLTSMHYEEPVKLDRPSPISSLMTCPTATSTPLADPMPSLVCACATAMYLESVSPSSRSCRRSKPGRCHFSLSQ